MQATFTTTMSCGSCLNKVRPYLENVPGIKNWQADLSDARKLLRFELREDINAESIGDLIRSAGFEATLINEEKAVGREASVTSDTKFTLSIYKPLFLVVGYVIGAAFIVEYRQPDWNWMNLMSNFMGFFFLGFAFFKLLDISKFADAFATYDVIAKRFRMYGLIYPFIEFGLGLMFVTQTLPLAANLVTAIIMSVGLAGVIAAVRKKQAIQCACLGTAFNLPMSAVTIIENSVMVAMAIAMLFYAF